MYIFQEINHAAAGGIWAELVDNRGMRFWIIALVIHSLKFLIKCSGLSCKQDFMLFT